MEIFSFAALVIAAIGVYIAVNSNKTKSDQEYVKQLETRIERLEAKLEKCERKHCSVKTSSRSRLIE